MAHVRNFLIFGSLQDICVITVSVTVSIVASHTSNGHVPSTIALCQTLLEKFKVDSPILLHAPRNPLRGSVDEGGIVVRGLVRGGVGVDEGGIVFLGTERVNSPGFAKARNDEKSPSEILHLVPKTSP